MKVINVRNVHQALPDGLDLLRRSGVRRKSRNGPVLVHDGPVTTCYQRPTERVVFWPTRDANPFFHLVEAVWMLAGQRDVATLKPYVARMADYSDDGQTLHGAYGHRWRSHFGVDQLLSIVKRLKDNREDRRAVLSMWDPPFDLTRDGKDLPCNTHAYFSVNHREELDMTVCCRSNDIIWGAYGANAVHFSVLQEVMAAGVGVQVGRYWQVSNNYHAYLDTFSKVEQLADEAADPLRHPFIWDPYELGDVVAMPLVDTNMKEWLEDAQLFFQGGVTIGLRNKFFRRVLVPMTMAHLAYRRRDDAGRYEAARSIINEQCLATDWRRASLEWIDRRQRVSEEKAA